MSPPYDWPAQDWQSEFFAMAEAKYPTAIDRSTLVVAEMVREELGLPLTFSSDARLNHDMRRIFGPPPWDNSPHWVIGDTLAARERNCKALDLVIPMIHRMDTAAANAARGRLWLAGLKVWHAHPELKIGCELATGHLHIDTERYGHRRPWVWLGVSR